MFRKFEILKYLSLAVLAVSTLAVGNVNAVTYEMSENPYNVALTLMDQSGNASRLYSFWFGYGPETVVRDLDINGGLAELTLNGTVRVADITTVNGVKNYSYYESGAGVLNLTFTQAHDLGNGVIGGGSSGFGSFAYTNGSETANISLMATAMTIPGFSEANAFFFGDNILVGNINSNNIFDFVGWLKGTSVSLDGVVSSTYTAKGDLYLSNAVPEPATMVLLGSAMLGGALKRKRKNLA